MPATFPCSLGNPFEKPIWKRLFVLCLALAPLQQLRAQYVEISAELEIFGYQLGNTNSMDHARRTLVKVDCIAGTNGWSIADDFGQRKEWLFDGSNVLCRAHWLSKSGEPQIVKQTWASDDGNPMGDFGVNLPWLAFCSGSYLKRDGRRIPLPAAELRTTSDRFAYTDVTTRFPDETGLPTMLDLFSSRARFLSSETDWDKEHSYGDRYANWRTNTAPKLQEGVLVFHYAVLESTNVLGQNFPTKFEFFQTGRQYQDNGNWFCQGTGRVKSICSTTNCPGMR